MEERVVPLAVLPVHYGVIVSLQVVLVLICELVPHGGLVALGGLHGLGGGVTDRAMQTIIALRFKTPNQCNIGLYNV